MDVYGLTVPIVDISILIVLLRSELDTDMLSNQHLKKVATSVTLQTQGTTRYISDEDKMSPRL